MSSTPPSGQRFAAVLAVLLGLLLPLQARATEARNWARLDNCRYIDNASVNDADSFQVRCGTREFVLRLYSVDAPESDAGLAERVSEQASSFGVSEADVLRIGRIASKQVRRRLLGREFIVWTRWADVPGHSRLPRYYGALEVDGGDLGQWLLSQGYARVKGLKIIGPRGGSASDLQRRLHLLELRAQRERRGLWGIGRATLPGQESS
ncbi:MAG: thermonuclease family protein [Leptothrix sp. (in: b-proteobacteria)]